MAEMRRRGLRDQAGDIRRGWCGGRCGRDAASWRRPKPFGIRRTCRAPPAVDTKVCPPGVDGASLKHRARDAEGSADLRLYHHSASLGVARRRGPWVRWTPAFRAPSFFQASANE